jgi:DNA-binding CsgD family transcriptional regulator
LGVLNSLHALTDLFLYWNIPEYANRYATEAVKVEKRMTAQNPMISAQTYINKGRTLQQLGEQDSVTFYTEQARRLCQTLPYNSGMVDVDLLSGSYLTDRGGDSVQYGIEELIRVTEQGTTTNRAKAYHQLAQTYLRYGEESMAERALDSLYALLNYGGTPIYIRLEYEPILNHYQLSNDHQRYQQFTQLMLQEQNVFNEKSLKYNTVESIVNLQTIKKNQELKLAHLKERHHRQWFLVSILISLAIIAAIVSSLYRQKRAHSIQMKKANEKFSKLHQELKQTNAEKEKITSEINEFLNDNNNRQEMETLTPFILKESGEVKFRQCFEILYPLFLHRLREKVPSITRREELLSMLIALKQNNKEIAELLAIAPRSVLMLRHRFRQKIGMATEYSLEYFIEELLGVEHTTDQKSDAQEDNK